MKGIDASEGLTTLSTDRDGVPREEVGRRQARLGLVDVVKRQHAAREDENRKKN